MRHRSLVVGGGVLVALVLALVFLRKRKPRPAWTDPEQPDPVMVAAADPTRRFAGAWATPMVGPCPGYSAGSRTLRTYPASLADSCASFIVGFEVGAN